ncbi:diacylglycerol kinase [Rosenbergiella australiborealis]|uniref:diacylglycerol kinase n=1 Tax=Rosenbergiella australiborealis TaxID=1544696 RepID=UPI001F4DA70A|nr:diacylglycerol kinase [Rosenbergiella australiborealis]
MSIEKHTGLKRLLFSINNSWAGVTDAFKTEDAFRHIFIFSTLLILISFTLSISKIEHVLLILCSFLLIVIELLNTAIETVVDRISLEIHPLSKRAKDMAGAAQLVAIIATLLTWLIVIF